MKMDRATRTRLLVDMKLDVDPAETTIHLSVDGVWYPATWQGTATKTTSQINGVPVDEWKQTAQTDGYFCGPTATPAGAVVLTPGRHRTQTRVTGDDTLVNESSPIDVT